MGVNSGTNGVPGFRSLRGGPGTDTATSRLDIRDMRYYNNSSSLSNFVLPQTTYRTNRTNRSYRSGNGYGLINTTTPNNEGGGTLRMSVAHGASASVIPQQAGNLSAMQHHKAPYNPLFLASYSGPRASNTFYAQRQQHKMSQQQPSVRTSGGGSGDNLGEDQPASGPPNQQSSTNGEQVVGAILDELQQNRGQL